MIRRKIEELTVIPLSTEEAQIRVDEVFGVLKEKPSDTVYVTLEQKLYGIITGGDIKRCGNGVVSINKNFTCLTNWNHMKARKIFKDKSMIHKIPVVDDNGYLIGDFSCWDEKRWWRHIDDNIAMENNLYLHNIYLVQPKDDKAELLKQEKEYFDNKNIEYFLCDIDTISLYLNKGNNFIFVDEDELCTAKTIYLNLFENGAQKLYTYKTFMEDCKQKDDGIFILNYLQRKGVQIYTLSRKYTGSKYVKEYTIAIQERNKMIMKDEKFPQGIPKELAKDFLAELYTEEYYKSLNDNLKFEICYVDGVVKLKDVRKKYFNVIDGERVTVAQPSNYKKTIYFFGPCIIRGAFVEDKYTIESLLQKKLNDIGEYRVVNCGAAHKRGQIDKNRILETAFHKGDIAIIFSHYHDFGFPDLNIWKIAEKYQVPIEWSTDMLLHCNHKMNQLIAEEIFLMIQSELSAKLCEQNVSVKLDEKVYIKENYIDQYFSHFDYTRYNKIGSIVMNCNPFTKGHRYLIEKACEMVDFLVVFVVEEDASFFTFEERFEMVQRGTSDLEKVYVVPSGKFILSKITFPEYFVKVEDEDLKKNVDYDITLFADSIAKQLKITCRFVGEEPYDVVTNEYNSAMKRILPKKGIDIIEIPRKEENGVCISASTVRKYLENDEAEQAYMLVPETTKRIIQGF